MRGVFLPLEAPVSLAGEMNMATASQLKEQLEKSIDIIKQLSTAIYEFRDEPSSQASVNSLLYPCHCVAMRPNNILRNDHIVNLAELEKSAKDPAIGDIPIPTGLLQ